MGTAKSTKSLTSRERRTAAAFAIGIGLFAIVRHVLPVGDSVASWVEDLAWTSMSFLAAWRSAQSARHARERGPRLGWALLAAAAGAWFLGMLWLLWGRVQDPTFVAYPTPANWLFLAFAPLFTAGLYQLRSTARSSVNGRRLADLGLLASSLGVIVVFLLVEPVTAGGRSGTALLFSILDPAAFATALVFALIVIWLGDLDDVAPTGYLLLAAIGIHFFADTLFFRGILIGGASAALPLQGSWLVAFALQYLAAMIFDRQRQEPPPQIIVTSRPNHGLVETVLPAVLMAAMAIAWVTSGEGLGGSSTVYAGPLVLLFAVCLGAREWWVDRSEEVLFAELRSASQIREQLLVASPALIFSMSDVSAPSTLVGGSIEGLEPGVRDRPWLWSERLHPDDYPRFAGEAESVTTDGPRVFDARLKAADGHRWVTVRLEAQPPGPGTGDLIVGTAVDTDITKRLQERLLRTQRMEALGQLAGGVAHDFNNFLTSIGGYADLGRTDPVVTESTRERFEKIVEASNAAGRVTNQLLAFSRKQPLRFEGLDVSSIVAGITTMVEPTMSSEIELLVTLDENTPLVRGDRGQLEQAVLNLVVNARDAIPAAGRVRVETSTREITSPVKGPNEDVPAGRYVLITVQDDGVGMSSAVRDRVFEPFFTTKPSGKGTGLGLATVYGVVRQHSGYVTLDSEEGLGTTFCLYLPVAEVV